MTVYQLKSQNFKVVGRNRRTLNISVPGNVLVFFKMDGCRGCQAVEPIFHQLAKLELRINYGVINLSQNREVTMWSRQTSTPIQAVPLLLLYTNGNPLAKFKGKKNIPALKSFITKALRHAPPPNSGSSSFMGNQGQPQQGNSGVNNRFAQTHVNKPDFESAPSVKGIVKGSTNQYLDGVDEDDEELLKLPKEVTPYNVPWESNYRKIGTID